MESSPTSSSGVPPLDHQAPAANPAPDSPHRFVDFWWVQVPGRLRRYSFLVWAAWSDGTYLTAWPRLATILPLAVLLFGFLEGATHWTFVILDWAGPEWGITHLGQYTAATVFAEILPMLVLAPLLGSLSTNLGVMLATGYALGDFLLVSPYGRSDFLSTFFHLHVPQLICYLLFLLLSVWPALGTRVLVAGVHRRFRQSKTLNIALSAVVVGLFIYEWTYMAPMVFRVAWVWQGGTAPFTVVFFHAFTWPWLVGAGVIGVLLRHWLQATAHRRYGQAVNRRIATLMEQAFDAPAPRRPWLRALLAAGYMTLLIAGFLNGVLEGLLIFAAIAAGLILRVYLLPRTALWRKWTVQLCQYPALLRLGFVVVGTYFLCRMVLALPGMGAGENSTQGQFASEVLGLLLGLLLMMIVLPNGIFAIEEPADSDSIQPRIPIPSAAVQAGLIGLLVLLATKRAWAQVCADPYCCFQGNNSAAAVATSSYSPSLSGSGDIGWPGGVDPYPLLDAPGDTSTAKDGGRDQGKEHKSGDPWWKRWAEKIGGYLGYEAPAQGVSSIPETPPGASELAQGLTPEGAAAEGGALQYLRDQKAEQALSRGDTDEYYRIRNMSGAEFVKEFGPPQEQ